jgi:hypothetical protein
VEARDANYGTAEAAAASEESLKNLRRCMVPSSVGSDGYAFRAHICLAGIPLGTDHDASQTKVVASHNTHCISISNLVEMY